ncbi:MAG: thioredoxin family protein [Thermoanaerobaculia bacterium]|nr:thioredoxin family protein [Thermoanaerobaculia bacterium]
MTSHRRSTYPITLALMLWSLPLLATESSPTETAIDQTIEWQERTVDLYIDAQLRSDARVLYARDEGLWAVAMPDSPEVWILREEVDGEGHGSVENWRSDVFTWTHPLSATSASPEAEVKGNWTTVAGGWFARAGEHAFLALPHQGPAGVLLAEELWQAVPSWQRLAEAWEPEEEGEAEAMEVLDSLVDGSDVSFEVVFGTWCGDSRRSVPKLLAASDRLGLDVSLVAIRRGFEEPLHYARENRITNVPTILVKRRGLEIGRFVERPRSASVITDLAAIVERRPVPPPRSFSDTDEIVARGEYVLRAEGEEVGRETWSLFRTEQGQTRLGSRRVGTSGDVTELWQRWALAADGGRTGFVEVTRDARGERSRTRLSRRPGTREEEDAVHALTRGDASGIVEQDLALPAEAVVVSPGVAAGGLSWEAAGRPESIALTVLVVPGAAGGFAARQDQAELTHVGRVELFDPGLGDLVTDHVLLRRGGARPTTHEWWIHADLGIPVRAVEGGVTAELVWLEVSSSPEAAVVELTTSP